MEQSTGLMNKLCLQYTLGFAGDELYTCLMLNRPCFELNLRHMAAITERKQCIFSLSATLMLKQNNSSKQHSQFSISPPNGSFFFTLQVFHKAVSCFSFKHVRYSSQGDVTTLCSCWCSSLFYILLIQFLLINSVDWKETYVVKIL